MVTMKSVKDGIAAYVDKEFLPQLPSEGVQRLLVGTAVSIMLRRFESIVKSYKNHALIKMLGIIDENDNVDIEVVLEELGKNMGTTGFTFDIPALGIMTFKKEDVDKLYEYIIASIN